MKNLYKILSLAGAFIISSFSWLEAGYLVPVIAAQPVATHSIPPTQQRPVPCAQCLNAWGTHKREGCNHNFCHSCFTQDAVKDCPTCTEEANQCAICLELYDNTVTLVCGHMFCKSCIENWQASQAAQVIVPECPTCRAPLVFKETVLCEICMQPFKDKDDITPPLVCKMIGWALWREKYVCVQQFSHRFHDKCFNQHYMKPGQHTSNLHEHTCICPVHTKPHVCAQHPSGCSHYAHPWGHIKILQQLPERGAPSHYVEYVAALPTDDPPSPRTAQEAEEIIAINERNDFLRGKVAECVIQ